MKFPKPWFRPGRGVWYVTLNGKQINLGSDREAAFQKYRELIREPETPGHSLRYLVQKFLEWTEKNRRQATHEWYKDHLDELLSFHPRLLEIRPFHVLEFLDTKRWGPNTRRGPKAGAS